MTSVESLLAEARAVHEPTTPGEWCVSGLLARGVHGPDAEFIGYAHNRWPELLDTLAGLQAENQRLRQANHRLIHFVASVAELDWVANLVERRRTTLTELIGRAQSALASSPVVPPEGHA